MPSPVSATTMCSCVPACFMLTSMRPPSGVNLTALESRFHTPARGGRGRRRPELRTAPRSTPGRCAWPTPAARTDSTASSSSATGSTRRISRRSLPVTMRDRSSRSLIRRAWASTLRRIRSIAWRASAAPGAALPRTCSQPMIEFRGERNSCDTVARNSSLRRLAASACSRASANAAVRSSTRCSSVACDSRRADLGPAPFHHLGFERILRLAQLPHARDRQCARDQERERDRSGHRRSGSNRLHDARQPIPRVPHRPDFHPVRGAACHDEQPEQQEHPAERQIPALAHEVHATRSEWRSTPARSARPRPRAGG